MIPAEYLNQITTGDARELAKRLPDNSVDLIFTDPPYPKKHDRVFSDMAEYAGRVLKPGGRLMFLFGHYQLPLALRAFEHTLTYDWIIAQCSGGSQAALFQKRVWAMWKPCLVFRKGTLRKDCHFALDLFYETAEAMKYAKMFHEWGQGGGFFGYYIDRWTRPGDTVLDPFCGGGTVPSVCKALERQYIAFDIDPTTAEKARTRLAHTQPMHPVFLEEQHSMELTA